MKVKKEKNNILTEQWKMCFALPLPHYFDAQPMKNKTNGRVEEHTGSLGCYYIFFLFKQTMAIQFQLFNFTLAIQDQVLFC